MPCCQQLHAAHIVIALSRYNILLVVVPSYLRELEKLAKEAGFSGARHYEFGGGLMGNLVATR
jgi:demethylphylloquinol methyltransferase